MSSTHYILDVTVKKVTDDNTVATRGNTNERGSTKITTEAHFIVSDPKLSTLIKKGLKHLALVDESDD